MQFMLDYIAIESKKSAMQTTVCMAESAHSDINSFSFHRNTHPAACCS